MCFSPRLALYWWAYINHMYSRVQEKILLEITNETNSVHSKGEPSGGKVGLPGVGLGNNKPLH